MIRQLIFMILLTGVSLSVHGSGELTGKKAKDFTLKTLSGEKIKMSSYKGDDKVLLFFWTTWCPTCQVTLPKVLADSEKIQKRGVKLMLVNVGEDEKKVRSFLESERINVPLLLDPKFQVADSYSVFSIPTFVLIDTNGIIRSISHTLPDRL